MQTRTVSPPAPTARQLSPSRTQTTAHPDPDSYTYGQSSSVAGDACDRHYRFGDTRWSILTVIFPLYPQRHVRQCEILDQHAELAHRVASVWKCDDIGEDHHVH